MIKVGIIGCGKITEVRHAPEYDNNPDVEIAGFFDVMADRAEAMAEKYKAKAYSSLDELLADDLDAVSVCTANFDHAASSVKALQSGKHVLCEKPMATTLEECNQMIEAAKKNKKLLMIGQNQRFTNTHIEARKLISEGRIGRVIGFRTTFGHSGPENWTGQKNSWFFNKERAHFGAMADLGIHKTDLIHYLIGEPITEVTAKFYTLDKTYPDGSKIAVDDNAFCLYATDAGVVGSMHASWTFYGQEDNSTRIYGTEGMLLIYDHPEYSLVIVNSDGTKEYLQLDKIANNKDQTSGKSENTGIIDHFIDSITGREECRIDGEEALKAMKVIFAAEKSGATGRTERI